MSFMISEKSITIFMFLQRMVHSIHIKSQQDMQNNCVREFAILSAFKSPLCGLVVFIDMNRYILKKEAI